MNQQKKLDFQLKPLCEARIPRAAGFTMVGVPFKRWYSSQGRSFGVKQWGKSGL